MYNLTREHDNLALEATNVRWVNFDNKGRFKSYSKEIEVGLCLLMSPFNTSFTWLTTRVIEITKVEDKLITFTTKNSKYKLEWK